MIVEINYKQIDAIKYAFQRTLVACRRRGKNSMTKTERERLSAIEDFLNKNLGQNLLFTKQDIG